LKRAFIYLGLFLIVLVNYIDRVNLSVAAGPIRQALSLSPVQLGYIFSSFSWTYILFIVPLGHLVDQWGAKRTLPAALFVWSLGGVMTGFASGFSTLMVSRLVLGAGESVTYPAGARVIRDWVPREERGLAQAMMSSGQMFGPAFGAILVGWLVATFGWELSFILTGGLGVVIAVLWFFYYEQPENAGWLAEEEKQNILRGRDVSSPKRTDQKSSAKTFALLKSPSIWSLAFVQGCGIYTQYLFVNWLPSYLQMSTQMGVMSTGLLTAIPYVFAGVCVISVAKLSDRIFSRASIATGSRRSVVALCLLMSSVILSIPFIHSFWLILTIISLSIGFAASATALNLALANDLLRNSRNAGMAASFVIFGGNLFGAFAPVVTGYAVAGSYGFKGAFVIAGVLLVLGALVCAFLTRKPLDEEPTAERSFVAA
jgi:ACS family glucarate transporter-like MFS transporter